MKTLIKSVLTLSISTALFAQSASAATYDIIDLGVVDSVKHTYGIDANTLGQTVVSAQTSYNFPVQFDLLDEDDFDDIVRYADNYHEQVFELNDIEDEDALRAGNPTANDLSWTISWLRGKSDTRYQKISDTFVFVNDAGVSSTQLSIFDTVIPGTSELSRTTVEVPKGITEDGWVFGSSSSPYLPLEPYDERKNDDDVVHWITHGTDGDPYTGFTSRGFIKLSPESETIEATPLMAEWGGLSAVNDININKVAVGTSSVALNPEVEESMLDDNDNGCNDPDYVGEGRYYPREVCIFRYKSRLYFSNAVKWTISADGTSVEVEDLGTGITNPNEEDERAFTSSATSINDNGIIVGYSHFWWDYDETPNRNERVGSFAAVFKDGEVIDFTDRDTYFESRAYDIANTGMFTGYMYRYVNGKPRTKFFYADANAETIEPIFPEDFFKGSSSIGYAINNSGFIVGEGEIETFVDSSATKRRRHGFLYDIKLDKFYDVNSFLSCEQQAQFDIVEARGINDDGVILATAFAKQERLDSKGEPLVLEGTSSNEEDVLRAVYLTPDTPLVSGEEIVVNDCAELEEKTERQGASFGYLSLFALMLLGFRRKR
ncbi:DUF3466 family protein [Thalassomonas sp. M1454]|uniref:DUF3466 family protein n=1 Tax=Thalassomonas sp. M1454 TaxID=2594477 RepID=UPI0011802F98|nr:DUF3466 family protein [Thalassomonas sp. M1454]TRX56801.1 DUF3466 family protein [Thalassomonas sp. M1454]